MEKVFKFFTTFHFHTVRARAHIQPNNIINFHGFLVITIIKFPRRIAARFIGELLRGELTSVVGRDGTGYRSPGAANWKQYRACLSDVERVENREATRGFHERKCSFPRRNENFGRLQVFQALDLENVARCGEVTCVDSIVLKLSVLIFVKKEIIMWQVKNHEYFKDWEMSYKKSLFWNIKKLLVIKILCKFF